MHDKQILHCIISVTSPIGTEFDFRAYGILQQQCIFITCVQGAFFTDGIDGNDHFQNKCFLSSLEQGYLRLLVQIIQPLWPAPRSHLWW